MSSTYDRIDPELRAVQRDLVATFPGGLNDIADLGQRRAIAGAVASTGHLSAAALDRVAWTDRHLSGADETWFRVRIYTPIDLRASGCILYLHTGGMIMGDLDFDHAHAAELSDEFGVRVVSVEYRLAPEHPYPAALDDCVAAFHWLTAQESELDVSAGEVIVYGASAGGGLAIALALRLRDADEPLPGLVMAPCPMIDDRPTPSSLEFDDIGVWDRRHNVEGWDYYLGGRDADQFAAPARAEIGRAHV